MKNPDNKKLNTQIYSEASEWLVEFRTGDLDLADRRAFTHWLRTSPEHVRAYLELAAIWNEGSGLDPERKFDDETLVRTALAEGNVLPLDRPSPALHRSVPGARVRPFAIAATVFVAVVGAGVWLWIQRGLYTTEIGEQRFITLADGSHIELNVRSRIRIHFTDTERRIDLLDGQAYFHVAKDKARPFIVASDSTRVRAVGTQFDVYRKKDGITVTVLEGTVAVLSSTLSLRNGPETRRPGTVRMAATGNRDESIEAAELLLAAGEQAVITAQITDQPAKPDIAAATAWTRKSIVFQSAPLIEVAEEFNRYNRRPLVVQSPEIHDFQISGIFSSADPSALLRFLETRPGIVVIERKDDILVARKP